MKQDDEKCDEKRKKRDFWVMSGKVKSQGIARGVDGGIGRRERTLGRVQ